MCGCRRSVGVTHEDYSAYDLWDVSDTCLKSANAVEPVQERPHYTRLVADRMLSLPRWHGSSLTATYPSEPSKASTVRQVSRSAFSAGSPATASRPATPLTQAVKRTGSFSETKSEEETRKVAKVCSAAGRAPGRTPPEHRPLLSHLDDECRERHHVQCSNTSQRADIPVV